MKLFIASHTLFIAEYNQEGTIPVQVPELCTKVPGFKAERRISRPLSMGKKSRIFCDSVPITCTYKSP
jgi:hypothetical protein